MVQWASNARQSGCALRILTQDQCYQICWGDLDSLIANTMKTLQQQGISENSGVALIGKNSAELLVLYLACLQLGARVLGVNPAFPSEKIQCCLQENGIDFFYTANAIAQLSTVAKPLNFAVQWQDYHSQNFSKNSDLADSWQTPTFPENARTMTLTSGSSGKPKAIVHNVAQHFANARGVCELMNLQGSDCYLLSLPLFHVSGQGIVWRWLLKGATLLFSTENFYHALTQATHASLVPTQAQRFLEYLTENPTQNVVTRHILLGGACILPALTHALQQQGITPYCGYGMTEMASTIFAKIANGTSGVGQPLAGREWQLVNEEIWLKGAGLALGYWQNGEITPLTNAQGFLQTKDKACWKNNELHILGRIDNQFISGGENIQPEEIETLLLQHSAVETVFIVPKKDETFGERPVALIQFKNNFTFEQNVTDIQNWLNSRLEKFKQPVDYIPLGNVLKNLPQTGIKISRHLLKQQFEMIKS